MIPILFVMLVQVLIKIYRQKAFFWKHVWNSTLDQIKKINPIVLWWFLTQMSISSAHQFYSLIWIEVRFRIRRRATKKFKRSNRLDYLPVSCFVIHNSEYLYLSFGMETAINNKPIHMKKTIIPLLKCRFFFSIVIPIIHFASHTACVCAWYCNNRPRIKHVIYLAESTTETFRFRIYIIKMTSFLCCCLSVYKLFQQNK